MKSLMALVLLVSMQAGPALAAAVATREAVVISRAPLKPRKAAEVFKSPDKSSELIVADTVSNGDFPTSPLFVRHGTQLYALGETTALNHVKWAPDGKSVSFDRSRVLEYGVSTVCRVNYKLGDKSMTVRVLRTEKVEASG